MERLINSIVNLMAERDQVLIERLVTTTIGEIIPEIGAQLIRVDDNGEIHRLAALGADANIPLPSALRELADGPESNGKCEPWGGVLPEPFTAAIRIPLALSRGMTFLLLAGRVPGKEEIQVAIGIVTIFRNYLDALALGRIDGLTHLYNRKTFDEKLAELIGAPHASRDDLRPGRHHSHGGETWLAVADIDRFKSINDNFGHVIGDEVLLIFSQIMLGTFRTDDLLFRYGGEEFAILLPHIDHDGALAVLERFRDAIFRQPIPQVGHISCSLGLTRIDDCTVPTTLFGRADQALYIAKNSGRNRVCCFEDLVEQRVIVPCVPETEAELF